MKESAANIAPTKGSVKPAWNFKDLTGQKFGKLTVLSQAEHGETRGGERFAQWNCLCDCGGAAIVQTSALKGGHTRSCSCLQLEVRTLHGKSTTPECNAWYTMIDRCHNPESKSYKDYGHRGITVCSLWRFGEGGETGFECFLKDMGVRPSPKHTLDRRENNGNYEPGNCRWATMKEQGNNRRSTRFLTLRGETLSVTMWAEKTGGDRTLIFNRLRLGWSHEDAVFEPKLVR